MSRVETGRRLRRDKGDPREEFCKSCQQRLRYGEPRGHATWAQRLVLERDQVDLLLVAAAEFLEFHQRFVERARTYSLPIPSMPTAVDFVDWLEPSVLSVEGGRMARGEDAA